MRNCNKELSALFQTDCERSRFDFNSALAYTDVERHSGPYPGFSAYVFRNDKPSG